VIHLIVGKLVCKKSSSRDHKGGSFSSPVNFFPHEIQSVKILACLRVISLHWNITIGIAKSPPLPVLWRERSHQHLANSGHVRAAFFSDIGEGTEIALHLHPKFDATSVDYFLIFFGVGNILNLMGRGGGFEKLPHALVLGGALRCVTSEG
jgi:hypothetical protein